MSLPRYKEYIESGVEWLGEIPRHWNLVRLKDVAEVVNGYPFDSKLFDAEGTHALIRIRDLNARETATRYGGEFLVAAAVTSSDVLIGMDGDFNVGRWRGAEPALLNQRMCCVRSPSPALSSFLGHALPIPLKAINDITYSTTVKHLSSLDVEKIRFAVPEDDELAAVVAFLDHETAKIDALIAEQEKLITLLAEKRQATISQAVTKGLNPNAPMKDSGVAWLGSVPAHWKILALKHLVSVPITDGPHETPSFPDMGIPFVSAEAVSGGFINFEKIRGYISEEDHQRYSEKYKPQLHDIYMVKSGATTGVTAIVESEREFNIWSPLAAIRCDKQKADPYFVLAVLRSRNFQEGVALNWSFGTQQNIGMGVLGDLPVVLPPLEEQSQIVAYLALQTPKLSTLSKEAERTIALLKERRSALIAAAVTGQIDVRSVIAERPEAIAA